MSGIILGIVVVLLLVSGGFNVIPWGVNIPVIAVLVVAWAVFIYNRLVRLDNRTDEAWADIDVQLKRRYDLIPNLINTVKGYAEHERGVFERVTEARSQAMNAEGAAEQGEAENMLTGALKSLFAVAEDYPDLKANENFLELQRELTDTEDKIMSARRFYNANVQDLNNAVEMFPSNVVAGMFSYKQREYFELEESSAAREPVDVEF
ncbi:MAG: LemA family protein [Candidatus Campbellbacteria bacterium]|nr:LemA family protein [Candidatus Campbellbacteria bacterium]